MYPYITNECIQLLSNCRHSLLIGCPNLHSCIFNIISHCNNQSINEHHHNFIYKRKLLRRITIKFDAACYKHRTLTTMNSKQLIACLLDSVQCVPRPWRVEVKAPKAKKWWVVRTSSFYSVLSDERINLLIQSSCLIYI